MCTNTQPLLLTLLSLYSFLSSPHTDTHCDFWPSLSCWSDGARWTVTSGSRRHCTASLSASPLPLLPSSLLMLLRWEQRQRPCLVTLQPLHLCCSFRTWGAEEAFKGAQWAHARLLSTFLPRPEVHCCWPCQELLLHYDVCSLSESQRCCFIWCKTRLIKNLFGLPCVYSFKRIIILDGANFVLNVTVQMSPGSCPFRAEAVRLIRHKQVLSLNWEHWAQAHPIIVQNK